MATTKPLNPSGKPGEADDLIEELARMMAAGAKDKAAGAPAVSSGLQMPAPAPAAAPGSVPGFVSEPGASNAAVPEPAKEAKTPRKSPPPYSVPAPDSVSGSAAKKAGFGFNSGGHQQAFTSQSTPPPVSGSPAPEQGASAPEQSASAPRDPIAELIRQQMQPATLKPEELKTSGAGLAEQTEVPAPNSPVPEADPAPAQPEGHRNQDGFRVPPVFGLGGPLATPAPVPTVPTVAPASTPQVRAKTLAGSTALDEIEQLIGNAVRVDLPEEPAAPTEPARQTPSAQAVAREEPALQQPLSTQPPVPQPVEAPPQAAAIFTPDSGNGQENANNIDSAEAAILQAMGTAAPGVARSDVLPDDASGPGEARLPEEPLLAGAYVAPQKKPGSALRRYVVPIVAVLLLGTAGVGGYFFLNPGGAEGDPPVLVADGTPNKTIPEPSSPAPSDQSVVFEGSSVPDTEQRLVSRDQTDGATVSDIRQVTTIDNSESGLANRRVRTVTVRPDGTIISGDDAVAGGEVLPVAQPSLPDLPASAIDTVLAGTTIAALPETADLTAGAEIPATPASAANGNRILSVNGTTVPFPRPRIANRAALAAEAQATLSETPQTNTANTTNTVSNAANPGAVDLLTALTGQPESAPPTPLNIANPPPAAIAQPAQTTVSNAYVQLASLRAQDVAEETASSLQTRYASALGGGSLVVRRVDLGDRGVFFRVLLPTASLSEASAVCNNIQNAGGDCFPRNN